MIGQTISAALAEEYKIPKDLKIAEYFSCFGSFNGWGPLNDQKNNPILNFCLRGATESELRALEINDLQERLLQLEQVNLIRKVGDQYQLAFPAIIGQKRAKLQEYAEQVAKQLLPFGEKMIEQIRPYLKEREEMIYHVLWSDIMDGPLSWNTAMVEMDKQVKSGDTSIYNKIWLLYPSHPFRVGTNSYNTSSGHLRITWSHNTPSPNVIRRIISQYESELVRAIEEKRPIISAGARSALGKYGLVNGAGTIQVYTLKSDTKAAKVYMKLGTEFGQQTMNYLDMPKVTDMLDVSPGVAFVIAYHEICWQLLQNLVEKKVLIVPDIVARAGEDPNDAYQLVSLAIVPKAMYPFLKTEMSKEEKATIQRFDEIKQKVLAGEGYFNLSTPVDSMLSYLSAALSKDENMLKETVAMKISGTIPPVLFETIEKQYRRICIYRVQAISLDISEGDVHPIYTMFEGEKEFSDVYVYIYRNGKWRQLFNQGNAKTDWRESVDHIKGLLK